MPNHSAYANPLVEARLHEGVLLERWAYEPGPPADIASHVHDSYQIGLALDGAGVYDYRGSTEPVPSRRLVIVHPGEAHAVRDTGPRSAPARYLMMYLEPSWLTRPFGIEPSDDGLPFFREPLADADALAAFAAAFRPSGDLLDLQSRLVVLTGALRERQTGGRRVRSAAAAGGVDRVRDMLHDSPLARTSLDRIAGHVGLSPWHLVRAFAERFGLPPHRYRRMLRIELAKRRLAAGEPAARVALRTGFYDQSHFGRHFRRLVGTTPSRYRSDPPEPAAG